MKTFLEKYSIRNVASEYMLDLSGIYQAIYLFILLRKIAFIKRADHRLQLL